MVRTFLLDAHLLGQFWIDVASAATFISNHLPTPLSDGHSPYKKLFHKILDYSFLRMFECKCFPTILSTQQKLEPRSKQCVFIGYASNYKVYRCLDPITGRVYISRHVLFHEDVFPYRTLQSPQSQRHNIFLL